MVSTRIIQLIHQGARNPCDFIGFDPTESRSSKRRAAFVWVIPQSPMRSFTKALESK